MTTYGHAKTTDRWQRGARPQRAQASLHQRIARVRKGRDTTARDDGGPGSGMQGRRSRVLRLVLVATAAGAVVLVPWTAYLALTLPGSQAGGAWRLAWVGFDIALATTLATTGWLAWNRRQETPIGLVVSATLLLTDAWFDVCLSWNTAGQGGALASAAFVEIPLAVLLGRSALRLAPRGAQLEGDEQERTLTTLAR